MEGSWYGEYNVSNSTVLETERLIDGVVSVPVFVAAHRVLAVEPVELEEQHRREDVQHELVVHLDLHLSHLRIRVS